MAAEVPNHSLAMVPEPIGESAVFCFLLALWLVQTLFSPVH
jgi:hypothetical protein